MGDLGISIYSLMVLVIFVPFVYALWNKDWSKEVEKIEHRSQQTEETDKKFKKDEESKVYFKTIDFSSKEHRKALIFGIFVGLFGMVLYFNGSFTYNNNCDFFESIFFLIPCILLGFISGLTYFSNKNLLGIFLPFFAFFIQSIFFNDISCGSGINLIFIIFFLVTSTLIVFLILFVIGMAKSLLMKVDKI